MVDQQQLIEEYKLQTSPVCGVEAVFAPTAEMLYVNHEMHFITRETLRFGR